MNTKPLPKLETACAWCQAERGEQSKSNQSHGICRRHFDLELANLRAGR